MYSILNKFKITSKTFSVFDRSDSRHKINAFPYSTTHHLHIYPILSVPIIC